MHCNSQIILWAIYTHILNLKLFNEFLCSIKRFCRVSCFRDFKEFTIQFHLKKLLVWNSFQKCSKFVLKIGIKLKYVKVLLST